MSRNRQTVGQRQIAAMQPKKAPFPAVKRPFLRDVAPEMAYARLRAGKCPKCAAYLLFDSQRERVVDYCKECDHVWTYGEQRDMFYAARPAELMKTA